MRINQAGIHLIETFEGCKLTSYQDQRGIWTIGYGHTGLDVGPNQTIDQSQADFLLVSDLQSAEHTVNSLVRIPLNDNEFSALVCLCFNIGSGNFKSSTLLKLLNNYEDPTDEFLKWDRSGGVTVEGLLRRRKAEAALFNS